MSEAEIAAAVAACDADTLDALKLARDRIESHHLRQLPRDDSYTDALGAELGSRWTAVESVGLYVPGGLASYPSSVLMNAVPAKVAGVPRVAMAVPSPGGDMNPLVLAAAHLAGVSEIYRIGGAQAVAALAYGNANDPAGRQDRRSRQRLRRRGQAAGVRHGRHRLDCGPFRSPGDRRPAQRSRMARRRSARTGRARHRGPGHPDDGRRGLRPLRRRGRRAPAPATAARQHRCRQLGDVRRRDRAALARRGARAGRPHRRRARRDRHRRSGCAGRTHPQCRRHIPGSPTRPR